jgi:flagellar FliL protein
MAKEKAKPDAKKEAPAEAASEELPKKKKGLGKLLIVLLLLGGIGGGAAWYFLGGKGGHDKKEVKKTEAEKPPVFERLETFTVNLAGGENFLQVDISLKVADPKVGEQVKLYMPEIRDRILRLLSSKEASELSAVEGKAKLSEEVKAQVNKSLNVSTPNEGVVGVYFTSFVIQ